ncbi:hypothetical protein E2C01_017189 [Portunus trituberculatus]|uniref:Uncharacterized protein n=1 Tax=Portunus trituberculatus TaxID=210409 RepID=A0A5B7DSH9_PORTR|nr:hypothetical protein [Portunus trituberculatus]
MVVIRRSREERWTALADRTLMEGSRAAMDSGNVGSTGTTTTITTSSTPKPQPRAEGVKGEKRETSPRGHYEEQRAGMRRSSLRLYVHCGTLQENSREHELQ